MDGGQDSAHEEDVLASLSANPDSTIGVSIRRFYFKCIIAILLIFWSSMIYGTNRKVWFDLSRDPIFTIFCAIGELIVLKWLWGFCMLVWRLRGIDFVSLLSLDETELSSDTGCDMEKVNHDQTSQHTANTQSQHTVEDSSSSRTNDFPENIVLNSAADDSIVLLVAFILFNEFVYETTTSSSSLSVAHTIPVGLLFFCIYRIVSPWRKRKRWLHMAYKVIRRINRKTIPRKKSATNALANSVERTILKLQTGSNGPDLPSYV